MKLAFRFSTAPCIFEADHAFRQSAARVFYIGVWSCSSTDSPQDLLIASASIDLQALKHNNASLGLENGEIKCAKSHLSFGGIVCLS